MSVECMISHVVTIVMSIIRRSFLVRIEIDTEEARNFPDGVLDPKASFESNGYNLNSYPNWDLNYREKEEDFIELSWHDFTKCFDYDGLRCSVTQVANDG